MYILRTNSAKVGQSDQIPQKQGAGRSAFARWTALFAPYSINTAVSRKACQQTNALRQHHNLNCQQALAWHE